MGWAGALMLVQAAHENILDGHEFLEPGRRAVDFRPVPGLRGGPVHSVYVDNVIVVGTDGEEVTRARRAASTCCACTA